MNPQCPACGGEGVLLGQLGELIYFRCRRCGSDFCSHEVDTPEVEYVCTCNENHTCEGHRA
jgi:tRNA(Ile2) C34 agmatinyltransferase TiaS